MNYILAGAIGAVLLGVLLIGLEGLRARKPKLNRRCGQSFEVHEKALECTLAHGHGGVHGCKRGKTNVWWEDDQ